MFRLYRYFLLIAQESKRVLKAVRENGRGRFWSGEDATCLESLFPSKGLRAVVDSRANSERVCISVSVCNEILRGCSVVGDIDSLVSRVARVCTSDYLISGDTYSASNPANNSVVCIIL